MWLGLSGPYAHSTYLSPHMTAGDLTVAMEIPPPSVARPPPPSAWKCPRLLIWDHTSPPPSPCVNKSTFLLFCPVSNRVHCKRKMAWGGRVLNSTQRGFAAGKLLGTGVSSWLELKANINICLYIIYLNVQDNETALDLQFNCNLLHMLLAAYAVLI